jgi:hypothetical protein
MGRHTPALLGGLFIAVLSSLPVVNICCCLWMVCGGMLTTYLQQQNRPDPIETADAVLGGVLAGLIGAIIASLVPIVMVSVTGGSFEELIQRAMAENDRLPEEWRRMFTEFTSGRNISIALLIFVFNIPLYIVFTMLGSLLGVAFFRKKTPPVVPPPQM